MKASIRTNLDSINVDGSDHEVSYSHVMLELDNGARYLLNNSETNHYGYNKSTGLLRFDNDVVYARMSVLVDRINDAISTGGKDAINFKNWIAIEPAYGSDRYCNPGIKM